MSKLTLPALPSAAVFPLTVQDISCVRGDTRIFVNLSFSVASGDVVHVTGHNGAGKTSLLWLLAGLVGPDQGTCQWQDKDGPGDAPERATYIGHLDGLKPSLTAGENLAFWAAFLGASTDRILPFDPFGISALLRRPVRVLSAGQKRRVSLSRLLMSSAWLWLLDEPTTALDTASQQILWQLIAAHCARGGAVMVSSHGTCPLDPVKTLDLSALSAKVLS